MLHLNRLLLFWSSYVVIHDYCLFNDVFGEWVIDEVGGNFGGGGSLVHGFCKDRVSQCLLREILLA